MRIAFSPILGFLTLVIVSLIYSCNMRCGPFPDKFKVIGLRWSTLQATYQDTISPDLVVSEIENDSVFYRNYAIRVYSVIKKYFSQKSFEIFPSAYACSPSEPSTIERIDSIVIRSDKDFDSENVAGKDLSALFDISYYDQWLGVYSNKMYLKDYLLTRPFVPIEFMLILREKPETELAHQFTVQYYQEGVSFDYFTFSTNPITILRD